MKYLLLVHYINGSIPYYSNDINELIHWAKEYGFNDYQIFKVKEMVRVKQ